MAWQRSPERAALPSLVRLLMSSFADLHLHMLLQRRVWKKARAFADGRIIFLKPRAPEIISPLQVATMKWIITHLRIKIRWENSLLLKAKVARSLKGYGSIITILKHRKTREAGMGLRRCNLG